MLKHLETSSGHLLDVLHFRTIVVGWSSPPSALRNRRRDPPCTERVTMPKSGSESALCGIFRGSWQGLNSNNARRCMIIMPRQDRIACICEEWWSLNLISLLRPKGTEKVDFSKKVRKKHDQKKTSWEKVLFSVQSPTFSVLLDS